MISSRSRKNILATDSKRVARKIDAVPGRLNETWFKATREGTFYGQCSELCGARHAFMPTAIRVVSEQEFAAWLEEAQEEFGAVEQEHPVQLAANAATR